jgi:hypothetical protein
MNLVKIVKLKIELIKINQSTGFNLNYYYLFLLILTKHDLNNEKKEEKLEGRLKAREIEKDRDKVAQFKSKF